MGTSVRLRLTAVFALTLFVLGASVLGSVLLVMTFVPDYRITGIAMTKGIASAVPTAPTRGPAQPLALPDDLRSSAVRIESPTDVISVLLVTSAVVFAVVLVAGTWLSWVVAGRVLRPVERLAHAAAEIDHGALDRRIALVGPRDEFHRLAETFNAMLDRISRSVAVQHRFAANASHELRTPLATTQVMLDVALADPEAVDVTVLASRLRETNVRSLATVDALLELADVEAGEHDMADVDLRRSVARAVDGVRAAADAQGIAIAVTDADAGTVPDADADADADAGLGDTVGADALGVVVGDARLLDVLAANLVANAVRHNVPHGRVDVRVAAGTLAVENGGPVIPRDEVERLTEPFHRRRGRVAGSHGLGLALVAAIVDTHGGTLTLTPRPEGGLRVVVRLPRTVPDRTPPDRTRPDATG